MRILLVDKSALFIEGLQNLLISHGYQYIAAVESGRNIFAEVREFKPDIILMDLSLPDSLELVHIIKAVLPECKFIMLTSNEDEDNLIEALKFGVSSYLFKSLKAEDLFNLLESLGRGPRLLDSL